MSMAYINGNQARLDVTTPLRLCYTKSAVSSIERAEKNPTTHLIESHLLQNYNSPAGPLVNQVFLVISLNNFPVTIRLW